MNFPGRWDATEGDGSSWLAFRPTAVTREELGERAEAKAV